MDERTTRRILDRQKRQEATGLRRSLGIVTSANPLVIKIDDQDHVEAISTMSYAPVNGDRVWISRSGNDLLVHGAIQFTQPVALTFATGWTNYGGGFANAEFYRANGRVYLSGTIKYSSGGSAVIATLPLKYRPSTSMEFPVRINAGVGGLRIDAAGVVTDATFSAGSTTALNLNGVHFRVTN